jgi:hypothetical protein
MSERKKYNWVEIIPELPTDVTDKMEILSNGGRFQFDLDPEKLGEDAKEVLEALLPIVTEWLNNPIFIDDFKTSADRARWEDSVIGKYGRDSKENKFRKSNRIRINAMGTVINSLQTILSFDLKNKVFTQEEIENLNKRLKMLIERSQVLGSFLFNVYTTVQELRSTLAQDPCIFIETDDLLEIEGEKIPIYIIQEILIKMCSNLEEIALHMLEKLKK